MVRPKAFNTRRWKPRCDGKYGLVQPGIESIQHWYGFRRTAPYFDINSNNGHDLCLHAICSVPILGYIYRYLPIHEGFHLRPYQFSPRPQSTQTEPSNKITNNNRIDKLLSYLHDVDNNSTTRGNIHKQTRNSNIPQLKHATFYHNGNVTNSITETFHHIAIIYPIHILTLPNITTIEHYLPNIFRPEWKIKRICGFSEYVSLSIPNTNCEYEISSLQHKQHKHTDIIHFETINKCLQYTCIKQQ